MLSEERSDSTGTVFRDAILLTTIGLVFVIMVLITYFNPPTEDTTDDPPGNLIFEIRWPDEMDVDVDLWVKGPVGPPVGYSNHGNSILNLLRDDLGMHRDISSVNHEITYSRGRPAGEYIVNLHHYASRSGQAVLEVPVYVLIKLKADQSRPPRVIFEEVATLKAAGDEITVIRFSLDDDGDVIPTSFGKRYLPLRVYRGRP